MSYPASSRWAANEHLRLPFHSFALPSLDGASEGAHGVTGYLRIADSHRRRQHSHQRGGSHELASLDLLPKKCIVGAIGNAKSTVPRRRRFPMQQIPVIGGAQSRPTCSADRLRWCLANALSPPKDPVIASRRVLDERREPTVRFDVLAADGHRRAKWQPRHPGGIRHERPFFHLQPAC
jgi:hypothetical protein